MAASLEAQIRQIPSIAEILARVGRNLDAASVARGERIFMDRMILTYNGLASMGLTHEAAMGAMNRPLDEHNAMTDALVGEAPDVQKEVHATIHRMVDKLTHKCVRFQDCNNSAENSTLRKCSRCKTVLYCSLECQRADWPRHKEICHVPIVK